MSKYGSGQLKHQGGAGPGTEPTGMPRDGQLRKPAGSDRDGARPAPAFKGQLSGGSAQGGGKGGNGKGY